MAFLYEQPTDDEQNKAQQGPVPISQAGTMISGTPGSDTTVSSPSAPAATPTNPVQQRAGTFTNLSQYLQQNAPQSAALTQQVGDFIKKKTDTASSAINKARETFNTRSTQGTVNLNQDLLNQVKQDASQVVKDPTKTQQFKQMRDAVYGGPGNLADIGEDYTKASSAITDAERIAQSLGTEASRRDIFQTTGVTDRATLGKNILNNLLLGKNVEQLKPLIDPISGLRGQLGNVEAEAKSKAEAGKNISESTRQNVQEQLTKKDAFVDQYLRDISQRMGKVATGRSAELTTQAIKNTLAQGTKAKLTPEEQQILGMSQKQYDDLLAGVQSYKTEAHNAEVARLTNDRPFSRLSPILDQMLLDQHLASGTGRLPNGMYRVDLNANQVGSRDGYYPNWVEMTPEQYAQHLGIKNLPPAIVARPAELFETPYDDLRSAIQVNNPYAQELAADPQQTQIEQLKLSALSDLLGIPLSRPNAPGAINNIDPINFDIIKALNDVLALRKGVK